MRKLAMLALALTLLLRADTYPRQPGIDVQHYVFKVSLSDESSEISGETTAVIRFVRDGVNQVALDLISAAGGTGMTVSEVTSAGAAVPFSHQNDRLTLTLSAAPKAGEIRSFTVKYRGIPRSGLKIGANKYGERCFFSANWPDMARHWLPTVDHPYDKATGEFIVVAPAKYQVVANGLLTEEVDLANGMRETHWKQSVPIATWLYNIGVAQFASRTFGAAAGIPLQTWVYHQDRDAGIATFEGPTRRAIDFYTSHIGPYPYEKLAQVEYAAGGGAMEHASAIFYSERTVTGKPADGVVAHETAHQWFGNSVTEKDWDDVWLSEGFATYFAMLTTEHYLGRDALVAALKRSRDTIFTTQEKMPGVAVVQTKKWSGIPNGIVYQKGGWSLHILRGQIGSDKFWAGIREYYRRFRDSNASTADFRQVMEEVSDADLGWFFDQWVYRAGSPKIEGTWTWNAGAKKVMIDLSQTQDGEPYRLPLDIAAGGKTQRVDFRTRQQHVELDAEKDPGTVELDPNTWLLINVKLARK